MILDTNVLIDAVSPHGLPALKRRLAQAPRPLYTTAANWGEICHGVAHVPEQKMREVLEAYLGLTTPPLQILHIDQQSAEIYGRLRRHLERAGQRLDDMDLLVAAVALRWDMVLVTGNIRHFGRVPGLKLENWLAED